MITDDSEFQRRPAICVVCMHRSGSSAVARLINLLGVGLGPQDQLLPPAADNPAGFWEHRGIVEINDEILRRAGGSWYEPPGFQPGWASSPALEGLRAHALEVARRDFSSSPVWGWKDPRTSLTLPFWQHLFPRLRYVICLRNPLDVARSLERRDGLSLQEGSDLWLAYTAAGLAHTAQRARCTVWFEDLLTNLDRELERIAAFLGSDVPTSATRQAHAFIAKDLQHHRASNSEVLADSGVTAAARAFFALLGSRPPLQDAVDRLAAALTSELGRPDPQPRGLSDHLKEQLQSQQAVISNLQDAIARNEAHAAQISDQVQQQHLALEGLQGALKATGAALRAQEQETRDWEESAGQARRDAEAARAELARIVGGQAWRAVMRLDRIRRRVAPPGGIADRALKRFLKSAAHRPSAQPRVSLLVPVQRTNAADVVATIASLIGQTQDAWEALLTGDTADRVIAALPADPRIVVCPPCDGGPGEALDAALNGARGAFVGVVYPGDELLPSALRIMLKSVERETADILYSDEQTFTASGPPTSTFNKPDWSPELLLSFPYTGRLCLMRLEMVRSLGGWRNETVAAEDYALVLAAARCGHVVRRVPQVLYRRKDTSLESRLGAPDAVAARRAALEAHIAATGLQAEVVDVNGPAHIRVQPRISSTPLVSIVIATRDRLPLLEQCIRSIEQVTSYPAYEIVIVDNDSIEPETQAYFARTPHRVVHAPGSFNFSHINNVGAREARGEYLLFLNNDTEVISPDWLSALIEWAQQPEIGCVGAKLLFPDGRLQHVGVTLHDGSAFHPWYGVYPASLTWLESEAIRNYSAVTAACLMVRRSVFEQAGGFDETFAVAYNDVELCVRILRRGYRHVFTPYATLYHYESASRTPGVTLAENEQLRKAIGPLLWDDPYCGRTERAPAHGPLRGHATARPFRALAYVTHRGHHLLSTAGWKRMSLKGAPVVDAGPPSDPDLVRWLDGVEIVGQTRIGLFMHPVANRTFRVAVGPRASLVCWLALMPQTWAKNSGGVSFEVAVRVGGVTRQTHSWVIRPGVNRRHRRWTRVRVPLSRYAGQEIDLTLATALPPGAAPAHAWAVWGDPLLLERKAPGEIVSRQLELLRTVGLGGTLRRYVRLFRGGPVDPTVYDGWLRAQRTRALEPGNVQRAVASLAERPRVSVITPVYNTDPRWLRRCVDSVRGQTYPEWEHCLADDGSTDPETLRTLDDLAAVDPRIKVTRLSRNAGISAASNAALSLASGDFVALLDHDDELAPDALFEVVRLLNEHPDADLVYTDEDKLEFDGTHVEPYFKPNWSPEYLRSTMYIGHLAVYRRALIQRIGGFRSSFDGSQDYDLALRATEHSDRVYHIPRILYHWRKIAGSAAGDSTAKPWGLASAKRALMDHVSRLPIPARVLDQPGNGFWRVRYDIVGEPLVSILIPTDGRIARTSRGPRDLLLHCLRSIVERTSYHRYELVIVDNGRLSPEVLQFLGTTPHRRVVYSPTTPFNFAAKVNFAAKHALGEHLLLLNDDTEVITDEWLSAMLEFSQQPEIGAVGGKLFYPDGRIQHVGVVLGIGGGACHVLAGQAGDSPGYFGSALVIRNYSAVTGACCMTRRRVFEEAGGFDERFALDFNDVDYCLRLSARGYRIVGTPFAQLYHFEGATFGSREHVVNPEEVSALNERWSAVIQADPFYNPNLTRSALDYSLRL